ncbi:hypothetical protein GCM10029964_054340 [Kibdelosporangium lantanae]
MSTGIVVPSTRMSLRDARRVIEAGEHAARSAGLYVHLVVLDATGDLVAHARMDGTWGTERGTGMAAGLARQAVDLATRALHHRAGQVRRFLSVSHRDARRRAVVIAAEPLSRDGVTVGAVGICGLSGDLDRTIALAAAKVFP